MSDTFLNRITGYWYDVYYENTQLYIAVDKKFLLHTNHNLPKGQVLPGKPEPEMPSLLSTEEPKTIQTQGICPIYTKNLPL
jgi:hypothetical protein